MTGKMSSPVIVSVLAAALALMAGRAAGAVLTVGPGGGYDHNTIQGAIDAAAGGWEIVVAAGTYQENISFAGKNLYLHSSAGAAGTIVEGAAGPTVTFSGAESANCIIQGFGITHYSGYGVGIAGGGSPVTIRDNSIHGNGSAMETFGGGIVDCDGLIEMNRIQDNQGTYGAGLLDCDGTIQDNQVTSNGAGPGSGGGLSDCGGTIQRNIISYNYADSSGGGLINCDGTIQQNVISHNEAAFDGGGLAYCDGEIRDNVISDNYADWGGGLAGCGGTVSGNVIANNDAWLGGGMHNGNVSPTVENCVFVGNYACEGGGMHNTDASPTVTNSIFWGNTSWCGGPDEVFNVNATPTFSYCDIAGGGGSGAGWDAALGIDAGGNIDQLPLFADMLDPDGPDGEYFTADDGLQLALGSPCIDAGCDAGAAQDILGIPRPYDFPGIDNNGPLPDFDMGAYEAKLPGDANLDGCVGGVDYIAWSNNYHTGTQWQHGDFVDDDLIDGLDYVVWSNNYLRGCVKGTPPPVPGPSSALLLALGVLGLRRRSRA